MSDITAIRSLVETDLAATDQLIDATLNSEIKLIKLLAQHLIHSGGKRLRPLIVLLGAKAFHYQGEKHVDLAAIIELIHTATLLHDDVVDASDMRRGQTTANKLWGNSASVLVGDFLYSRAFQMMVRVDNMQIMAVLANATNIIAEGEILQLLNCNDPTTTETRYLDVVRAKTGMLFATAAQLGAILTERSTDEISAIYQYGLHLGMAFQLVDDALDYSANNDKLGKPCGNDLAEGKPTLPLLYVLEHGNAEQKQQVQQAIIESNRDNLENIIAAIESTGAIAYTRSLAEQYAQQAQDFLQSIPATIFRDALYGLADFAINRDY